MQLLYRAGMQLCSRCGGDRVVYHRVYSNERLCRACFIETFERRVVRTIGRYNMLRRDDRIAVAVSGGKDSLALLHVLWKIEKRFPEARLFAVTVDEGIEDYREEAVRYAVEYANKLGVDVYVVSFRQLYGFDLQEVMETSEYRGLGLQACSVCGVLRRKAINYAAKQLGATVIATAHTLDDIVQTYFMNILRGDLKRVEIGLRREEDGAIPRVTPFRLTPEREVVFYAYLMKIPFQASVCPNASQAMRDPIRKFLMEYDEKYPGSLYAALKSFEKILPAQDKEFTQRRCRVCGEPSSKEICRGCELLTFIQRGAVCGGMS